MPKLNTNNLGVTRVLRLTDNVPEFQNGKCHTFLNVSIGIISSLGITFVNDSFVIISSLGKSEIKKEINSVDFFLGGGGSTHSTIFFYQQINTSQNDPNALKYEISQYKYFPNCDPYPPSHIAEYLRIPVYIHIFLFV